jgi:sugar-specific transcriptional regulator TrmB
MSALVPVRLDVLLSRLQTLGLTANEARAYVAVMRLGNCRVIEIAREARLQRPEVYYIMSRLFSLGLVEETLDRPARYRAASVRTGISTLSNIVLMKYKGIADGVEELTAQLEAIRKKTEERDRGQVRIVAGADNIRRDFREALDLAQTELWTMTGRSSSLHRSDIKYALGTISKKHLKARSILDIGESNIGLGRRLASTIEVKHYSPITIHVYGIDNKHVAVGLETTTAGDGARASELVTTYPEYVKLLREFFEVTWRQATPLNARVAKLRGHAYGSGQTRIVWGRESIFKETSNWHLRAKERLTEITTQNGPVRLCAKFEKELQEARARKIEWRILCHMTAENEEAINKLGEMANVRLVDRPFGVGFVLLDDAEAMIHYIEPDSADLSDSPNDLALVTTDVSIAQNFLHMVDSIWKTAKPLKRKRRGQ